MQINYVKDILAPRHLRQRLKRSSWLESKATWAADLLRYSGLIQLLHYKAAQKA